MEAMETARAWTSAKARAQGWEPALGGGGMHCRQVERVWVEGAKPSQNPWAGLGNDAQVPSKPRLRGSLELDEGGHKSL